MTNIESSIDADPITGAPGEFSPERRFSVSKKYFRPAVRILKLSKSFKILLIERAVGFLPPAHTPRCSVAQVFNEVF